MIRSRRPARRLVTASIVALVAAAVALPVAARTPVGPAGVPPFTVSLKVFQCRIDVKGVPQTPTPDPDVTITVKQGSTIKIKQTVSSSGGQVNELFCPTLFLPGDTVKLAANGQSRTITVPSLSASIDPATKRVRGKVPAGGSFIVDVWACDLYLGGACAGVLNVADPSTSSKGIWSVDLGSHDEWHPGLGDYVNVDWLATGDPDGDQFILEQSLDNASIRVGSAVVTGIARPGSTVALTLVAPGGAVRGAASVKASGLGGAWTATLRNAGGTKVKVRIGDTLRTNLRKTATKPGASIKAIDLRATFITDTTDAINGNVTCKPGRRIGLVLMPPTLDAFPQLYYEGVGDRDGRIAFSDSSVAVPLGAPYEAHCVSPQVLDQVLRGTAVAP